MLLSKCKYAIFCLLIAVSATKMVATGSVTPDVYEDYIQQELEKDVVYNLLEQEIVKEVVSKAKKRQKILATMLEALDKSRNMHARYLAHSLEQNQKFFLGEINTGLYYTPCDADELNELIHAFDEVSCLSEETVEKINTDNKNCLEKLKKTGQFGLATLVMCLKNSIARHVSTQN